MSVLLIAGSPSERSRSAALLDAVSQRLRRRGAHVERLHIREMSPQALLLATGGSPNHMLALDYALRPVLQSLGAKQILPGIYATDSQVTLTPEGAYRIDDAVGARLDEAVNTLVTDSLRPTPAGRFAPVPFSSVRCSV